MCSDVSLFLGAVGVGWVGKVRLGTVATHTLALSLRGRGNKRRAVVVPPHPNLLPEGEGDSAARTSA